MAASVELFAKRGFAATGIRDIATAAHLSSSSLYEYMSTKDDLLVEIMASTIRPLIAAGHAVRSADQPPEWMLATLTQNHVWFHATHPHETMVTDTELRALTGGQRRLIVELRDDYEAVWRSTVGCGLAVAVFDVTDTEVAARSLISLCTGIGVWYKPGGRLTIEQLCATHADLTLAAVRARRDGQPVRRAQLSLPDPAALVQPPP